MSMVGREWSSWRRLVNFAACSCLLNWLSEEGFHCLDYADGLAVVRGRFPW